MNDLILKNFCGNLFLDPNSTKKIDLFIKEGEKIAIVGTSGGGKSTLALALAGYPVESSNIILSNQKSLKDSVYYVHKPIFYLETLGSNLTCNYEISIKGPTKQIKSLVDAELSKLMDEFELKINLDRVLWHNADELSTGQKQRANLIRVLLLDLVRPRKIFVLDEITSALNSRLSHKIYNYLKVNYSDKTMICILHDLNYLKYFDRFLLLKDFEIVLDSTDLEKFKEDPLFQEYLIGSLKE